MLPSIDRVSILMEYLYTIAHSCCACQLIMGLPSYCTFFDYSSIALWAVVKKKPLVRRRHDSAVGQEGEGEGGEGGGGGEGVGSGWVTAVAALPNTDLVASGQKLFGIVNVPNRGHLF